MTLKSIPDAGHKGNLSCRRGYVAVIGGGYIGLEMVEALHLGKIVLFEMMDRLLVNFDIEISTLVYDHLIKKA